MAVTLRFQSTGVVPRGAGPVPMQGESLTIGRGEANDLVLADPDRMVSKNHCAIEAKDGGFVVIDLSTNGTFLNYGKVPLGAMPTRLNDGDILVVGPYELLVEMDDRPPIPRAAPPSGRASSGGAVTSGDFDDLLDEGDDGGDFLDDLIGDTGRPGGHKGVSRPELGEDGILPPLGEEDDLGPLAPARDPHADMGASQGDHSASINDPLFTARQQSKGGAIPEDWDLDLGDGDAPTIPEDDFDAPPGPAAELAAPPPAARSAPAPQSAGGDEAAARAFLKTLGVSERDLSDEDLVATMARLGHVLRIMIEGTQDVLRTRSSIKSEFRINQTTIAPRGNNPLKFSVTSEDAIRAMVRSESKGYLDAPDAARQAMDDVRAHELAMMTGMEAALKGLLARLSPDSLAESIETGGGIGSMLKGKKALYWEAYERMYDKISDAAENEFFDMFSREFAAAYQTQMNKLDRK